VWKSKVYGAFVLIIASSSTPSTRRLLEASQHGRVIAEK
jgi:hypothetical protein